MMEDWEALGWGQRDFAQQCSVYLGGGWRRGWDFQEQNVLISPARHVEEAGLGTGWLVFQGKPRVRGAAPLGAGQRPSVQRRGRWHQHICEHMPAGCPFSDI